MRLLLLAFLILSRPAWAGDQATEAVQGVIASQIDAFRHDDANRAFSFASPAIQQQFGDATRFLAIVRQAYAAVYRPRSFTFGAFAEDAGHAQQKVEIIGPDGAPVLALYTLEQEADGSWRISACELTKSELQQA